MTPSKIKAFTLTELLVTVLIIGILAAVAVPKFNRVVESRRTVEAEEILSSVRTEQEKRCSLDQEYTGYFHKLGNIIASDNMTPQAQTANYTYQLAGQGISAQRNGKDYILSIPSYADGRLCCSGSYCQSLNKNYPLCSSMTDLKTSDCSAPVCEYARQCNPGEQSTRYCECGSQTRTCGDSCQWGAYGGNCYAKYGGTGETRNCSSGCGTQRSVSTCSGESWSGSCWSPSGGGSESVSCSSINSSWEGTATRYCDSTCSGSGVCSDWDTSSCSTKDPCAGKTCSGSGTQPCPSGTTGTQTRTCDCGVWSDWSGTCTPVSKECADDIPATEQSCGSCGQKQTRSVTCNTQTGQWESGDWESCPADPTCSGDSTQNCPNGQTGTQTRACKCGVWSDWSGECKPVQDCSDAFYKAEHKSECCPGADSSDSVCYQLKWSVTSEDREEDCQTFGLLPSETHWEDNCSSSVSYNGSCSKAGESCYQNYISQGGRFENSCIQTESYWSCELVRNGW